MIAALLCLWLALGPAHADERVRVFALPHGGELLVLPSSGEPEVVAALVAPAGWATRGLPSYARLAWTFPEAAQSDLQFLQIAAPATLELVMEADYSVALVAGEGIDPRFTALAAAAFKREAPYDARWSLEGAPLDIGAVLASVLSGTESSPVLEAESRDFTEVLMALNRHPDRVLVVAGNVTEDEALDLARVALAPVEARGESTLVSPSWPNEPVTLTRGDIDSTWQIWGWPTQDPASGPGAPLLWFILRERVARTLRGQRGWTYDVSVSQPLGARGTACHLAVSTPSEVATDARDLVERELQALAETGPTEDELDRARLALLSGLANHRGASVLGLEMAVERIRTGAWSAPGTRIDRVTGATPAKLKTLAGRWLIDGPSARVRLDPE